MTTTPGPSTSLSVGQVIGGCRVVRFLRRGGMGEVYLAEHLRLQKPVALKILPKGMHHSESIARFLKEARSGSRIEHPNVVTIYDVGQSEEVYYLVMQYVEGRNLSELLERQGGPFPWRTALQIARRVGAGVQAVHRQGLIHRDIKPSNIMLSSDSRVLLMDFGLVRDQSDSDLTQVGQVLGTPHFMSPEQCRGESVDAQSDVYSLGSTLYCLLAARPPFEGRGHEVVAQIAAGRRPRPLYELNPTAPRDVSDLVARLMSPRPNDRPDTAGLLREIAAILRTSPAADPASSDTSQSASAIDDTRKLPELIPIDDDVPLFARLGRRGALLGGALLIVLAAGLAVSLARSPRGANRSGMVRVEAGYTQLGVNARKLRAHLASLPLATNEKLMQSAFDLMSQEPNKRVFVKPFWIDAYEVTNSQYADFLRATGRAAPAGWNGPRPPNGHEEHPVADISFSDAEAYAAWARKKLPTREQWMRAFRGDSDRLFPWGDDFDALRANVMENKNITRAATTPVRATPGDATPLGVYNLVGDVSEFLREQTMHGGRPAVITKGGDFRSDGSLYGVASTQCFFYLDGEPAPQVGFRCVVEEP